MIERIPVSTIASTPVFSPDALPVISTCQNEQYLIQAAQVEALLEDSVVLKVQSPKQCKACVSQGGCSLGLLGRWALKRQQRLVLPASTVDHVLPEGAWLWIGLPKRTFLNSIFFLYFVPTMCFLVGGALGGFWLPAGWSADLRTALGMLAGAGLGLLCARTATRSAVRDMSQGRSVSILWPLKSD